MRDISSERSWPVVHIRVKPIPGFPGVRRVSGGGVLTGGQTFPPQPLPDLLAALRQRLSVRQQAVQLAPGQTDNHNQTGRGKVSNRSVKTSVDFFLPYGCKIQWGST